MTSSTTYISGGRQRSASLSSSLGAPRDVVIKNPSQEKVHRDQLIGQLTKLGDLLKQHKDLLEDKTLSELFPWVNRVRDFVEVFHLDYTLIHAAKEAKASFPWICKELRSEAQHPPKVVQKILQDVLAGKDPKVRERLTGEAGERFRRLMRKQAMKDASEVWSPRWVEFCRLTLRWIDERSPCDWMTNFTAKAKRGELPIVVGRNTEIAQCWAVLSRRTKNNVLLVGEPGVGKTAIVEGLAQQLAGGKVPSQLQSKQIFSLDVIALQAGADRRGELASRMQVLTEVMQGGEGRRILFIDELHAVLRVRGFADQLKPSLARGEYGCIGATTFDEYRNFLAKDPAFDRRFQVVRVPEMSDENTHALLNILVPQWEGHYGFPISQEAIQAAVLLSSRYLRHRRLPDKAIDVLETAASQLHTEQSFKPRSLAVLEEQHRTLCVQKEVLQSRRFVNLSEQLRATAELSKELNEISDDFQTKQKRWDRDKQAVDAFREVHKELVEAQKAAKIALRAARAIEEMQGLIASVLSSVDTWHREINFDMDRCLKILKLLRLGKSFAPLLDTQLCSWTDRKDLLKDAIQSFAYSRSKQQERWQECDDRLLGLCLEKRISSTCLAI